MSVQTIDDLKKQRARRLKDLCEEIFHTMRKEDLSYAEMTNVVLCVMMKVQQSIMET